MFDLLAKTRRVSVIIYNKVFDLHFTVRRANSIADAKFQATNSMYAERTIKKQAPELPVGTLDYLYFECFQIRNIQAIDLPITEEGGLNKETMSSQIARTQILSGQPC